MNNQIQIFENEEFGEIRVLDIDGQPWFVGRDVAGVLGYKNQNDALSKHVDDEDKGIANCDTLGGAQKLSVINESGLYSLILSSKLPSAKRFKRWVTSEVLPSIRKHGAYITDAVLEAAAEDRDFIFALLEKLRAEKGKTEALLGKVEDLAPKARYCDLVLRSKSIVPISIIAKDYGMSANSFNTLLHGLKIQYKMGGCWLLYQSYADKGYTKTRTYYVNETVTAVHTYWTQSGRLFLYEILKWHGILPMMESKIFC